MHVIYTLPIPISRSESNSHPKSTFSHQNQTTPNYRQSRNQSKSSDLWPFKDPNKTNFTNPNSTISLTNINQATPFANKTRSTKQQGQNKNLQVSHRIYQESIHSKSKQLDTKKGISEKGNVVNKIRYLIEKERKEKRRSEGGEWELVAVKEAEKERERRDMTLWDENGASMWWESRFIYNGKAAICSVLQSHFSL